MKLAAADNLDETEEDYINANFIPGELIVQMQKASKATYYNYKHKNTAPRALKTE